MEPAPRKMIGHFFHELPHNSSRIHRYWLRFSCVRVTNAMDTGRSISLTRQEDRLARQLVKQSRGMIDADNHCRTIQEPEFS